MKTLLTGIALAIAMVSASQAFALPNCPNGNWEHDWHHICANYDQ